MTLKNQLIYTYICEGTREGALVALTVKIGLEMSETVVKMYKLGESFCFLLSEMYVELHMKGFKKMASIFIKKNIFEAFPGKN